ncbi:MAG: DNA helicase RecQ [Oscillospiraceae bacterium]|nr:DNA helicase RecQ [Oscillospiraceae bacterium]
MSDKYEILKSVYGYDSFRPAQEDIIDSILSGRDVLAVMPTGAGKSVCFQVPALMLDGITLVISPLISLMADQVSALVQSGVRAAYLNSSLTAGQQYAVLNNIRAGTYKIVYVAPERLETEGFLKTISDIKISMIAVDEAHCISQWGQDFRPSYMNITSFAEQLPYRPVISAFTATATDRVKRDIIDSLKLNDPYSVTTGFDRNNLYFGVIRERRREEILLKMIEDREGKSGIVYCSTRKNVEKISFMLENHGISAAPYHAGMPDADRRKNQEDFIYDRIKVIVATNAFGMGIDKSNVSYVIHYNMPKDMESYYQEAGRAGRDGENADCVILFSGSDYMTNKFLIENGSENEDEDDNAKAVRIKKDMKRLNIMMDYCSGAGCLRSFILRYFGDTAEGYCGNCSYCLDNSDKQDITVESQKILSCIIRMEQRFGASTVIDVLRGSKAKKIYELGFDKLSTYGIMEDTSAETLRYLLSVLQNMGYIVREGEEYPVLKITPKAMAVLKGREIVEANLPSEKKAKRQKLGRSAEKESEEYSIDPQLLSKLKKLRTDIASKESVPAYVVFSDATLRDMCAKLPRTSEQMLGVAGIGAKKMEKYGNIFLDEIKKHIDRYGTGEKATSQQRADNSSPLSVIAAKAKQISPSSEELPITQFADHLIGEAGLNSKTKPVREAVSMWLISKGFLTETTDDKGISCKTTTPLSEEIGIHLVSRMSAAGTFYSSVVYTPKAQQFILDHFTEIAQLGNNM